MNSLRQGTDVLRLDASVVQFFAMLDVRAPSSVTYEHLQELLVDAEIAVAAMSMDCRKASAAALAHQLLTDLHQQLSQLHAHYTAAGSAEMRCQLCATTVGEGDLAPDAAGLAARSETGRVRLAAANLMKIMNTETGRGRLKLLVRACCARTAHAKQGQPRTRNPA